ncbi:Proline-rich membrane anchor 1 [Oryzias melastigma]|uniref:Proline-rich membrane anchor 1 n=1 Tax=Oryzias melastigma TaxID=30732 RepID=A0A3B3CVG7_ORYME|nr:proline-rich membrane anchor 1 isoform X1 [Oryzias melastigma]KAF6732926.1 Proline-rich membrane anchor 1 [Oryzias melastigma]
MLPTRRFQEENDCGINYFWRRLSQVSPLDWTGWMVISQKIHVFCIQLWEKLPTIYQNSAKRGMLVQDLIPFTLSFWPLFFGHCLLSLFLLSCQGELQRSCSRTVPEKVSEQCQLACHCRRYPPLPPPPPPPPPPRLLGTTVAEPMVPLLTPWWMEVDLIVLGTVGCVSVVFLLSAIIICYKAIKRKPLRKEENGTSRGEYAMSIRNTKTISTNNTVV